MYLDIYLLTTLHMWGSPKRIDLQLCNDAHQTGTCACLAHARVFVVSLL